MKAKRRGSQSFKYALSNDFIPIGYETDIQIREMLNLYFTIVATNRGIVCLDYLISIDFQKDIPFKHIKTIFLAVIYARHWKFLSMIFFLAFIVVEWNDVIHSR